MIVDLCVLIASHAARIYRRPAIALSEMRDEKQVEIAILFDELSRLSLDNLDHRIDSLIRENPENVSILIEIIYFLLDFLLYARYKNVSQGDLISNKLLAVFNNSRRFDGNAEYLCYVGYLMTLAFWAFGQPDLSLSHSMLKRATELKPDNKFYEWACAVSTSRPGWIKIANELLNDRVFLDSMSGASQVRAFMLEAVEESVRQYRLH